jgi:RNA polymerase sigma-70 factor, ECF subfamily
VFTVARHRAIDWHRQAGRRPAATVPVERLAGRPVPDDPVAQVLEGQSTRAALALLAELPADQAEVAALRVHGGLEVCRGGQDRRQASGCSAGDGPSGLRRLAKRVEAAGLARGVTL